MEHFPLCACPTDDTCPHVQPRLPHEMRAYLKFVVCRFAISGVHDSKMRTPSTLAHAYVVAAARCDTNAIESREINAFTSTERAFKFSRPRSTP
jgi:hypothetical protein